MVRRGTSIRSAWIVVLNKAGVPCAPINSVDMTFADPQVKHLGIARDVKHPKLGSIKVVGNPSDMTASPPPKKLKPSPDLG
jgi:crotonobetainyl-CoA:carnitine CoA-transferase CaiB-like acyl-CoA transferase